MEGCYSSLRCSACYGCASVLLGVQRYADEPHGGAEGRRRGEQAGARRRDSRGRWSLPGCVVARVACGCGTVPAHPAKTGKCSVGIRTRQPAPVYGIAGLERYKGAALAEYYRNLQERIGLIPGVSGVGISQHGPVGSGTSSSSITIPGGNSGKDHIDLHRHLVGQATSMRSAYRHPRVECLMIATTQARRRSGDQSNTRSASFRR